MAITSFKLLVAFLALLIFINHAICSPVTPATALATRQGNYLFCTNEIASRCTFTTSTHGGAVDVILWDYNCNFLDVTFHRQLNSPFDWYSDVLNGNFNIDVWSNGWKVKFTYGSSHLHSDQCTEFRPGYVACQIWFYC